MDALRGAGVLLCLSLALAGLLLALLPGMDHLWLDWLEEAAPAVRLAFLTPGERAAHRDSGEALARGTAELARLRALQQDVQWGARQMPGEQRERLRQFLASRAEIVAGDRVVLATLRAHARARQRFWLGPRCSCWARRAPHGWACSRGHGAAGQIRTARRADTTATALGAPAPPRASARPHRSLALGSGPCQIGRCPRPSDAANRDRLRARSVYRADCSTATLHNPSAMRKAEMRVELKRPSARDESRFLEAARRSRTFLRQWAPPPCTSTAYRAYIKRLGKPTHEGRFVVLRGSGDLAGVINVSEIVRGAFQSAYLGYYAFVPHAGRGHMTEGLALALRWAFGTLHLHRVEANIQPDNEASRALVRRLGFRREGFSPRYLKIAGRWRDHERWALVAEDWRRQRREHALRTAVRDRMRLP